METIGAMCWRLTVFHDGTRKKKNTVVLDSCDVALSVSLSCSHTSRGWHLSGGGRVAGKMYAGEI